MTGQLDNKKLPLFGYGAFKMSWIYLIIASLLEVCWIYCIKFLKWADLLKINLLKPSLIKTEYLYNLGAFVGYVVFGIGNIIFLSLSMKTIPASAAYAAWMAIALVVAKISDIAIFKEPFSYSQVLFIIIIIIGVVGLKFTSNN